MRALILAGGVGTRLRPLTFFIPKCMVSVHGRPFIDYILQQFKAFDVVLSLGYKADVIKNYCKEMHYLAEYCIEIHPLGTGGALKNAQEFLENYPNFCVVNGDTAIEVDMRKLKYKHKDSLCTVLYARRYDSEKYVPSGIYFFNRKIFKHIKDGEVVSLEDVIKRIPYKIIKTTKRFVDIGTHKDLRHAKNKLFLKGTNNVKESCG